MSNKSISTSVNKGIIKKLFKRLIKIIRKMMNNTLKSKKIIPIGIYKPN